MRKPTLAVCVAILLVGCGTPDQEQGVDPPAVDPQRALTLTVEPPAQPVPLQGAILLEVWLTNFSDQSLVICRRLDCSGHLPWPTYKVRLFDATGQELAHHSYRFCGTRSPVRKEDFFRLQPGERVNVFPFLQLDMSRVTYATEYPDLEPDVPYTLAVTYRMVDAGNGNGTAQDSINADAAPLLREALRCEITSAPVPMRFASRP
jgi:hypothetical protein